MNKKRYSRDEVLEILRKRQGQGTQNDLAESLGVSSAYLSDVFLGRRDLGVKILEALGMYREWSYFLEK